MGYHITRTAVGGDGGRRTRATGGLSLCRWRFRSATFAPFVPSATSAYRNVPQSSSSSPVTPARLAKVTWLSETVIVEVAKLGIC